LVGRRSRGSSRSGRPRVDRRPPPIAKKPRRIITADHYDRIYRALADDSRPDAIDINSWTTASARASHPGCPCAAATSCTWVKLPTVTAVPIAIMMSTWHRLSTDSDRDRGIGCGSVERATVTTSVSRVAGRSTTAERSTAATPAVFIVIPHRLTRAGCGDDTHPSLVRQASSEANSARLQPGSSSRVRRPFADQKPRGQAGRSRT
jgi:hypothetical protein